MPATVLLDLYDSIPFPQSYQHQDWLQAAASVVFLAALLACSTLTYHLVEAPMQRLGKRVGARLDVRFGTDTTRSRADRVAPRFRGNVEPRRLSAAREAAPRNGMADAMPARTG